LIGRAALSFVDRAGGHQREDVGVAIAAADEQFVIEKNIFLLAFVSGSVVSSHHASTPILNKLYPSSPSSICALQDWLDRKQPCPAHDTAASQVWCVRWNNPRRSISSYSFEPGSKKGQTEIMQVKVVLVELVHHSLRIGIILVKDVFAFAVPPEPVLDDVVRRELQLAVFPGHVQNFFLRLVAVFALPEPISPASE